MFGGLCKNLMQPLVWSFAEWFLVLQLSVSSFASQRRRGTIHWSTATYWLNEKWFSYIKANRTIDPYRHHMPDVDWYQTIWHCVTVQTNQYLLATRDPFNLRVFVLSRYHRDGLKEGSSGQARLHHALQQTHIQRHPDHQERAGVRRWLPSCAHLHRAEG